MYAGVVRSHSAQKGLIRVEGKEGSFLKDRAYEKRGVRHATGVDCGSGV